MEIQLSVSKRTDPKVAEKLMLEAGLKPLEPYKSANEKWKCVHLECGRIVFPQYSLIQRGQGGCRPCSFIKTGLASRISQKDALIRLKKQQLELVGEYKWVDKRTYFEVFCLKCKKISTVNWDALGKRERNAGCETCARASAGGSQVTLEKHIQLLAKHNLIWLRSNAWFAVKGKK